MKGYITKGIGGFYYVKTPEGIVECKPRGIFRKQKITPVAGDEVTLETENGAAVIAEIAPRKNVFVRPPVANLDVLFLVASTTQPTPSTLVLDKLAAIAVDKGVQPVIVCTKGDLAEAEFLRKAYEKSTLPFIRIENLEHAFPEFGPYLGQCQFTGCSHRSEKGCAVRAALAEGRLSQTRYDSYCAMYEEVKDVKDWQRPKV